MVAVASLSEMRQEIRNASDRLRAAAREAGGKNAGVEIWYRGCPNGKYKLLPSLLRYSNGLDVEVQLWKQYCRLKEGKGWDTLFDMQHYFVPTRLLDWTTASNVALYFALNAEDCSKPSIYVLNPWILNRQAIPEQPRDSYPDDYAVGCCKREWPLAIEPPFRNPRITAQCSVFTVHGRSDLPIDDLCPESLEKIILDCSDLETERKHFCNEGARSFQMFPDETGMAMALKEQFGLKPSSEQRVEDALSGMWKGNFQKLPELSECAFGNAYIPRDEIADLWKWLKNDPNPFAILTGEAGSGKTNLLVAFAEDVVRQAQNGEGRDRPRLVLYFSLSQFDPEISLLLAHIADYIGDLPSRLQQSVTESDLRKMIRDGRIVLILDGLDELARTKGEEAVDSLRHELSRLADKATPKIVLACRDHILNRLEQKVMLERRQRINLDSKPIAEIKKRLPKLPPEAVDIVADTLLFYGVLSKGSAILEEKFTKVNCRPDFFRILIGHANDEAGLGYSEDQVRHKLGVVATRMLESRSDSIGEDALGTQFTPLMDRLSQCKCKLVIRDSKNRYRFIHQAIREFILAWNIKDGILHPPPGNETLLTTTHCLDYEHAETYLHLRELLELDETDMDRMVAAMAPHLRDFSGTANGWSNYLRNYFEAVAMLGVNGRSRELLIEQALAVIAANEKEILYRAKYEAARCLARLHPSAPQPLCDYYTGEWLRPKDSSEWVRPEASSSFVYGFAARGFHRRERNIAESPPEAIRWHHEGTIASDLTSKVIYRLLETVRALMMVPELPRDAEFLYVNCSHALIRWLNKDFPNAVQDAKQLADDPNLRADARVNLLLAVERCNGVLRDDLFENAGELKGRRVRSEVARAWGLPIKRRETSPPAE